MGTRSGPSRPRVAARRRPVAVLEPLEARWRRASGQGVASAPLRTPEVHGAAGLVRRRVADDERTTGGEGEGLAGVAFAVVVDVALVRVRCCRAVVLVVQDSVAVGVLVDR